MNDDKNSQVLADYFRGVHISHIYRGKLLKFLLIHNAYDRFVLSLQKQHRAMRDWKNCKDRQSPKNNATYAFYAAFEWYYTKEGSEYWSELNKLWLKYLMNN